MVKKVIDRRVIITENLVVTDTSRRAMAHALYDHYQVASVLFIPLHVAALLPVGKSEGLVVDVGYQETSVMAVKDGVGILKTFTTVPCGGKALHK